MTEANASRSRLAVIAVTVVAVVVLAALGRMLLAYADGPVFVFAGGPFRSGEPVAFESIDWAGYDALSELEIELVGAGSSRILWFSVYDGAAYVACDLDCVGGVLPRWPQQIERDDRVVIRIEGQRVEGVLVHVPHGSDEYVAAKAARERKYSGDGGGRAAAETAAHGAVVGVGEVLTGRAAREEPGDRLYRFTARVDAGA